MLRRGRKLLDGHLSALETPVDCSLYERRSRLVTVVTKSFYEVSVIPFNESFVYKRTNWCESRPMNLNYVLNLSL